MPSSAPATKLRDTSPKFLKAHRSDHPIVLLIGLIAAVVGLLQAAYDAWRSPDVNLIGSPIGSKLFEYPFAVKNNSVLFDMKDAQILCGIKDITTAQKGGLFDLSIADAIKVTIAPEEIVNYRCSVGAEAHNITSGHIDIWVKYRTLFFPRTFEGTKFTWYTDGPVPQWIKGTIVNDPQKQREK